MTTKTQYTQFLETKAIDVPPMGRVIDPDDVSPTLFDFQQAIVRWAVRKGRAAIFADTGLGKTLMQLEWARIIGERTLILAPLAVANQTVIEAREKLGMDVVYARKQSDAGQFTITNYEMLSQFDISTFGAVVLDESSILKSFDGKTRTSLIEKFQQTPYRLCCTATPAPNDLDEFGNHAEFLGICSRRDMLATYFVHRDDGWSIKGHAVQPFYKWMASWAMMVKMPSDIGFSDEGYVLPPLTITPEWVDAADHEVAHARGQLFLTGNMGGISGRSAVRKATIGSKVDRVVELVTDDDQTLIWCGLNGEADNVARSINGAVNVQGSDSPETKAAALTQFARGEIQTLVSKVKIAGFGLNFQRCHRMVFVGLSDSYEQFYQAIRRCWRYGQTQPVDVRVVISEAEAPVLENVMRKQQQAEETSRQMVRIMATYEREELGGGGGRGYEYQTDEAYSDSWRMLLGDCAERLNELPGDSIDMSVFSPPFLSLYSYTASDRDMGNCATDEQFFGQFAYLVSGLMRVTKPGRLVACHVAQVPSTLVDDGVIGLKDFRGAVISAFVAGGFVHHGEVVIDKDPQAQAIRTHSKGLLFTQLHKDSSWSRPALPDYILLFRKPGENAIPIQPDIDNNEWIEWARPIWYGIRESDTLNVAEARSEKDEKHIAPLQLGTIERCIRLWSNPGELVLSPFAGIGSEGYQAIINGRRFVGIELKPEYYKVACRNLDRAVIQSGQSVMAL